MIVTQDACGVDTLDGRPLTQRQIEFAADVGATSALSGTLAGCVFLYRDDAGGTVRWWVGPGGRPMAVARL